MRENKCMGVLARHVNVQKEATGEEKRREDKMGK